MRAFSVGALLLVGCAHSASAPAASESLAAGELVWRSEDTVAVAAPCLEYLTPFGFDTGDRAIPAIENGNVVGMKLLELASPNAKRLQLQEGDIWTALDNLSLSNPATALDVFSRFKSNQPGEVTLEIIRDGATQYRHIIAVDTASSCEQLKPAG